MSNDYREDDIDQLNSFLRGEISAVETYDQALEKADNVTARSILQENRNSHSARVQTLRTEITRLGGDPSDGSGAWGTFAKAVEGGAKLFGESMAISALEEGEDHGVNDYERDYDELSGGARILVTTKLLPEQKRTHAAIERLKEVAD